MAVEWAAVMAAIRLSRDLAPGLRQRRDELLIRRVAR
jgi:hypothetical protein